MEIAWRHPGKTDVNSAAAAAAADWDTQPLPSSSTLLCLGSLGASLARNATQYSRTLCSTLIRFVRPQASRQAPLWTAQRGVEVAMATQGRDAESEARAVTIA